MISAGAPKRLSKEKLILLLDAAHPRSYNGKAVTNMVTNGDFSQGTANWWLSNGTAIVDGFGVAHSKKCVRIVRNSQTGWRGYIGIPVGSYIPVTEGSVYTISFFTYRMANGATYGVNLRIDGFDSNNVFQLRAGKTSWVSGDEMYGGGRWWVNATPGGWTRLVFTLPPVPAGVTQLAFQLAGDSPGIGTWGYVTGFMMEEGNSASPYTPDSSDGLWHDLSGTGNHFLVKPEAHQGTYFSFINSIAKYPQAQTNITDPYNASDITLSAWARPKSDPGTWRTLFRGTMDHHLLIQTGTQTIGFFDNHGAYWIPSNLSLNSMTDPINTWHLYTVVMTKNPDPYYWQLYVDDQFIWGHTDAGAIYSNPIESIGGYSPSHRATDTDGAQHFGDVAWVGAWARQLTSDEVADVFHGTKRRFNR